MNEQLTRKARAGRETSQLKVLGRTDAEVRKLVLAGGAEKDYTVL